MPNPLHVDVNCISGQVAQRELSDEELADHQAEQATTQAAQQADENAQANRRQAVRAMLQAHPELQPLIDLLRLRLT